MARRVPLKTFGADAAPLQAAFKAGEISADEANAAFSVLVAKDGLPFDYRSKLLTALETPPQGISILDFRKRRKVANLIDAADGDNVVMEEAEFATLKDALTSFIWKTADRATEEFLDDVEGAEPVELK